MGIIKALNKKDIGIYILKFNIEWLREESAYFGKNNHNLLRVINNRYDINRDYSKKMISALDSFNSSNNSDEELVYNMNDKRVNTLVMSNTKSSLQWAIISRKRLF